MHLVDKKHLEIDIMTSFNSISLECTGRYIFWYDNKIFQHNRY